MDEPGWDLHIVFSSSSSSSSRSRSSSRSSSRHSSARCVQNGPVGAMLDSEPPPSPLVTTASHHMRADGAPQLATKRKGHRASKSKRERYRSYASHLLDQVASDPAAFDVQTVALPSSITRKPWLVAKLKKRIRHCIQSTAGCTGREPGSSTGDASTPTSGNAKQSLNLSACSSNTGKGGETNQRTNLSGL